MSSSYCWRCVSRTSTASARPFLLPSTTSTAPLRTATASFHTTAPRNAMPPKRKSNQRSGPSFREARASRVKSKGAPAKSKRLTPDERRALGRRIVLSNANALEVSGMEDMSAANVADPNRVGQVMGLPMALIDKLRSQNTFKPTQNWNLFRRPATLIRQETVELAKLINEISNKEAGSRPATAMVVDGAKGTGKSIHLTQAITLGLLNDWIVVSMPDAEDLIDARIPYAPIPDSKPVQYVQPDATSELIQRIIAANSHLLTKLSLSQPLPNIKNIAADASLLELANLGAQRRELAWPVFKALWAELTAKAPSPEAKGIKPFVTRPPMLVTADCFAHWMRQSKYLSSELKPIHAHDFCLVEHFVSLGQRDLASALPNGGLVLYATSKSSVPILVSCDVGLQQVAARAAGIKPSSPEFPNGDPYDKADYRVAAYFKDAKNFGFTKLTGLPKKDVKGLLEYYARSGVLREKIDEHAVGEKWTLSGGGVIGELEQLGRRLRTLPLTDAAPEAATTPALEAKA